MKAIAASLYIEYFVDISALLISNVPMLFIRIYYFMNNVRCLYYYIAYYLFIVENNSDLSQLERIRRINEFIYILFFYHIFLISRIYTEDHKLHLNHMQDQAYSRLRYMYVQQNQLLVIGSRFSVLKLIQYTEAAQVCSL